MKKFLLALPLLCLALPAEADYSIEDFNASLPSWGTSWTPGDSAIGNFYYPSFYTGFVMRANSPERIHVRAARGNQSRVSVILDEQTVSDYMFDLAKRYEFYQSAVRGSLVDVSPRGASVLPQLEHFNEVIESNRYGILPFVRQAQGGSYPAEAIYQKGLETLKALNPGRVFNLRINLTAEFAKWKSMVRSNPDYAKPGYFAQNPKEAVVAINSLLWGRVNYVKQPSADLLKKLSDLAALTSQKQNEDEFVAAAVELFRLVTGNKYAIRTLENGRWENALRCPSAADCVLAYPEFTAIYPTGSVMSTVTDQFGNKVPKFATPGLWQFLSRRYHEVDNIRDEPYYGWIPKMDFQEIGNGFHNPAVRFSGLSGGVKKALGIPAGHSNFWSVKRGGVSHGCLRLPSGHIWEMRHIFPVENAQMTQINFFGNDSRDFDVYDIDGDGKPELMGVEYLISYGLKGTDDLARREGSNLEIGEGDKMKFYQDLYGARSVFSADGHGNFVFKNPTVSLPSYLDFKTTKVTARLAFNGNIPLYEAPYERDKIQFYLPFTTSGLTEVGARPLSKRIVRLFGRVRGCAPNADKNACGETAFDREAAGILKEAR